MKIVVDNAIPFIKGLFEPFAEVVYLAAGSIDRVAVSGADALVVRTRTICNESLLHGSKVRFIATATIGYDHIDLEYCAKHNITVTTAAGCNAGGVLQWVSAALCELMKLWGREPKGVKIGVVGVGNVGSLVQAHAAHWGFEVLCCDPPRAACEEGRLYYELEELLPQVDILTLHTPLNDSTYAMINCESIKLLQQHAAIINSSRGEVLSTDALLSAPSHPLLIVVWEHEPLIDPIILDRALVATPHIAGYSLQGKANATSLSVNALARHFGLPLEGWYPEGVEPSGIELVDWSDLSGYYDICSESKILKMRPHEFEQLRSRYMFRSEKL